MPRYWWDWFTYTITFGLMLMAPVSTLSAGEPVGEQTGYGFGRSATPEEIKAWDIEIAPDGSNLPPGQGSVQEGAEVYTLKCVSCHGAKGTEGPMPGLVGGRGTLATEHPLKTVGSYWPYATTLFDYVFRAMPPTAPQSLTPPQVYAVVAWILYQNDIVPETTIMDAQTLPAVQMPNRNGFVPDSRPDISTKESPTQETPSANSPSISGLGFIDFPTSTSSVEAQQWFLRGVLLLHNFQYEDAKEAFQQAQALDPEFVMAYWGEAMTETHPLWEEQNVPEAHAILNRLAPTPAARSAKAPTQRERGYLQAVERLYGEGDKMTRDLAYADAMRTLSQDFPDDLEAAAFYALALLGSVQGERDFRTYMKAAAIGEEIFHKNPRHPGAVHYLIHAYDDPIHAPLGLRAARVYASLAPAAAHAQHMPSHIFMALGLWDDVIKANEAAWAANTARITQKGLTAEARDYHASHWLEYGYLQQGQLEKAKALVEMIKADAQVTPSSYVRGYVATMSATFTIEARQWDVSRLGEDRSGIIFSAAARELFAIGMSGINTQQISISQQALAELTKLVKTAETSSPSNEALAGLIMAKQLEGLLLLKTGENQQALQLLQNATEMEDRLPYAYGPPIPIKPAHELLGEVLLALRDRAGAKKEFELALERAPQRALSLDGLARSTP